MALHIRKNIREKPDGYEESGRVLTNEEEAEENWAFAVASVVAACGFAGHWVASTLLGELTGPVEKIAYVASIAAGIGVGAMFAPYIMGAAVLALAGYLLYLLAEWIFL